VLGIPRRIGNFFRSSDGASASEYAILVAVLAGIIFVVVHQFDIDGVFNGAASRVRNCVTTNSGSC